MNDKEAIEILKNECANTYAERKALAIQTILNLIDKQKHIIEGKECVIETQAHNEEVLLKQLEKKDMIIDLMAEYIGDNIDEEDCKKTIGNGKCEKYGQCLECIKEYFENKVKESK